MWKPTHVLFSLNINGNFEEKHSRQPYFRRSLSTFPKETKNTEDTDQDTNMSILCTSEADKVPPVEESEGFNEGLKRLESLEDSLHNSHMNLDAEGSKRSDPVMLIIPQNTLLPLMIL